ncbi:hypothetical protein Goshw_002677, partial [Gossypium schwendimanii]|nr:hypothetical protein [Gossypium schwendimanii]
MRGTLMLSWILIICLSLVAVQSKYYSETRPVHHRKPAKVTNLHFFMHEHTGVTAVVPDSKVIGNVQGIVLLSRMNASSTQYIDFGFNTGRFNGSSLSVFSRGEPGLAV